MSFSSPKRKGCHGIAAAFERDAEEMRKLRAALDEARAEVERLRSLCGDILDYEERGEMMPADYVDRLRDAAGRGEGTK